MEGKERGITLCARDGQNVSVACKCLWSKEKKICRINLTSTQKRGML
ncbi:unnamed protein product [marine sediment metagenome]|uniref:Uncharacterized protein n=1 Tax=marine sediment metagenome TaxID=412755 RepID=X1J8I3_9ZZZZ